jgi:hypothetical protein
MAKKGGGGVGNSRKREWLPYALPSKESSVREQRGYAGKEKIPQKSWFYSLSDGLVLLIRLEQISI